MSVFTSAGNENAMRWDGRTRGFMEVWYVTFLVAESGLGVWLRYTLTAPVEGEPYCELWAFCFDPEGRRSFAGKQRYAITELGRTEGRTLVRIADAFMTGEHLEGSVTRDGRTFGWALDFDPSTVCFQHVPAPMRSLAERRASTLCTPNLSVPFRGTLSIDDAAISIDGAKGCQTHRWGAKHSQTWAWAHASLFDDGDAVFEGLAAKTSLGRVPLPTSTFVFLRYGEVDIAFNVARWAIRARSSYAFPRWEFTARNRDWKMTGVASASPLRTTQVQYTDPDGAYRYCANSEIGDLELNLFERVGGDWHHEADLRATGTCHVEFGAPDPFEVLPVSF